jgi:hypothetical protein
MVAIKTIRFSDEFEEAKIISKDAFSRAEISESSPSLHRRDL